MEINDQSDKNSINIEFGSSKFRTIAVVSGKGGSGKTMVVASIAKILAKHSQQVLLMDADIGTGGMTFYLGIKNVVNTAVGLSDILTQSNEIDGRLIKNRLIQPVDGIPDAKFLGIGRHLQIQRELNKRTTIFSKLLKQLLKILRESEKKWILIDCRGGSDPEIIAVCEEADDILIIVESDTTSFQATRNLVDALSENDIAHKLRGFVINKVIEDPSIIARRGTTDFKCQYLSAIPFDLDAARDFLVGDIPSNHSIFGLHVWQTLRKAYPEVVNDPEGNIWSFNEFNNISLYNKNSVRSGWAISGVLFTFLLSYLWISYYQTVKIELTTVYVILGLGILGSVEYSRQLLGRFIQKVLHILRR